MTHTSDLLDRLAAAGELDLRFLQHRSTGTVHVVRPVLPQWMRTESSDPTSPSPDQLLNFALGTTSTLCGYQGRRHLGGMDQGDRIITEFPDDLLCVRCVRLLGSYSDKAFEHPQPNP